MDFESGQLVNPPLMPDWDGFSIHDYLREAFAAPVFVDNDVNLMAEAMRWKGGQGPRAVCGCLGLIEVDLSATPACRSSYRFDSNFVVAALYGTAVAKSVASWPTVARAASSRPCAGCP